MSVAAAVQALEDFSAQVHADLDLDGGGIRWLQGQIDWQRASLIGDYLLSAISGVQSSLLAADLAVGRYRSREFSDNHWLATKWSNILKTAGTGADDLLGAAARGPKESERELDMTSAAEHCLFHLAQGLDRMAVCVTVSGAFRLDLRKVDWTMVSSVAQKGQEPGHDLRQQPPAGLDLQHRLLTVISDAPGEHGPEDWLPWLLRARNTATHRPPKKLWSLLTSERRRLTGLSRPFHRQPGWAEMEALLRASTSEGLFDALLDDEPSSTLEGLTTSTAALVEAVTAVCVAVIDARRHDPAVLVHNGGQWPKYFDQPLLNFAGYGTPPRVKMDNAQVHVSPSDVDRMNAFRLGNKWAPDWQE